MHLFFIFSLICIHKIRQARKPYLDYIYINLFCWNLTYIFCIPIFFLTPKDEFPCLLLQNAQSKFSEARISPEMDNGSQKIQLSEEEHELPGEKEGHKALCGFSHGFNKGQNHSVEPGPYRQCFQRRQQQGPHGARVRLLTTEGKEQKLHEFDVIALQQKD